MLVYCIPYLQFDDMIIDVYDFVSKFRPNSHADIFIVFVLKDSLHNACLTYRWYIEKRESPKYSGNILRYLATIKLPQKHSAQDYPKQTAKLYLYLLQECIWIGSCSRTSARSLWEIIFVIILVLLLFLD